MNEDRLLKPQEVAEFLGIALTTLYGMTSARRIPFRKVGRLLRFSRIEIENFSRIGANKPLDPKA